MVKKLLFILTVLVSALAAGSANAQALLLDKTSDALQRKEPRKAREFIDAASANELTANDPRTWYLRSFVYKELYKIGSVSPEDYRAKALDYVAKCRELDSKKQYEKSVAQIEDYVYNSYYDSGVSLFNAKKYELALVYFEKYLAYHQKKPADETFAEGLYYAGYSYMAMGRLDKAQQAMEKSQALKYNSPLLYYDLSILYQDQSLDQKAYETVEKGLALFPENQDLLIARINLLIALKRYKEAEVKVEQYLQKDARNIDVLLVAGTIYGKLSVADSARREQYFTKRKNTYNKVLSIDPENFTANYNMGITLYNRGVDLIQAQDYDMDLMMLNELLDKVTALFKEALPYINKASTLAPKNVDALKALEGIYYNLNQKEKSYEIRERINKLN